ncbi:hypothetical protein [Candidatus Burkholderia verschuerenii]|uniref:hypothetical protein n=1 Tax=Candidatus Burkholderia verschuerenii TaxID=242163 RepID=UPI00067B033D|nr:hypothetical protein [Candidatus Burkholderia verschuerenii]
MSSLNFFEVSQNGREPLVDVGTINARELVSQHDTLGARLRFYARDRHHYHQQRVSYQLLQLFQLLLHLVTSPHSSVRVHLSVSSEQRRRFFTTPVADLTHVAQFAPIAAEDARAWLNSNDLVVLEADGTDIEVVKLLDAVYQQQAAMTETQAAPAQIAASDPQQSAIDFRNALLARDWRDGKGVATLLGMAIDATNPNQYAYRQRKRGALFGVWSAQDRSYRYPDFQFEHGAIRPELKELLTALSALDDRGGWRIAFWLYSPHARLDGHKPADVFTTNARRVIEAAQQEFSGEHDASW